MDEIDTTIEQNGVIADNEAKITKEPRAFTWTKDRIVLAIIFVIIMLISVALLVVIIVEETFLFTIVRDWFIAPILKIHIVWRIVMFLAVMVLQSLFAPIPSELILLSGGMLFGYYWGSLIGVIGSMFSAAITFYLAKRGGRSIVDAAGKKSGIIDRTIYIFDVWIKRWGIWAIIVGRAVPVIMFDPVSYAAGIANVKDKQYFLATFIGSIPRAIFYSILGVQLLGNNPIEHLLELTQEEVEATAGQFNTIFFIIFGVLVLMFVLSNVIYYVNQHKKKQTEEDPEAESNENDSSKTVETVEDFSTTENLSKVEEE